MQQCYLSHICDSAVNNLEENSRVVIVMGSQVWMKFSQVWMRCKPSVDEMQPSLDRMLSSG
jgi:hypothetical protein